MDASTLPRRSREERGMKQIFVEIAFDTFYLYSGVLLPRLMMVFGSHSCGDNPTSYFVSSWLFFRTQIRTCFERHGTAPFRLQS